MIAFLQGVLQAKTEDSIVIDVQGVGYEVFLGKIQILSLGDVGQELQLHIYTHTTESSLQLFGFLTLAEKNLFKKVISISGIGPKSGLSIVSALPFEALVAAILKDDVATLTSIPGIGKKTAERLAMELKDKIKNFSKTAIGIERHLIPEDGRHRETLQALLSLGYSEGMAQRAIQKIDFFAEDTVQTLIKKSLVHLSL